MDPEPQQDVNDQTEEVFAGGTPSQWSAYTDKMVEETEPLDDITFRDAATFVAEMTPIVGDAMAAKDVYNELQKEEPNYYLAGALGGAALVGLIPGLGDAAAAAIKKGAKEVFDVAKRVEVDPNAMGSMGGNVRLRPADKPAESPPRFNEDALNNAETRGVSAVIEPELLDYNTQVRTRKGLLDRDTVSPNDNIIYRPDRAYRFIGSRGYDDLMESGVVRAAQGTKKGYEQPYFMLGKSSGRYGRGESGDYMVEVPQAPDWTIGSSEYYRPPNDITLDSPLRIFKRNTDGSFEVVLDNIGDTALLPTDTSKGFAKGGLATNQGEMDQMGEPTRPEVRPNRKTDETTATGRPVWVDGATGEKYSERSVTFPVEEGGKEVWYTFPTVAEDGTQYDEDTIREHVQTNGPIDWITGEALPNFKSQEEAVNYAKERSGSLLSNTQQYAKGGEVAQMDKMYKEGGLATDGMDIDPVSGNEIPAGSNAVDVRDDVDAKLSEGEYVVPADVVKYFGVSYFEKLRNKAKEGLEEMQKDGRVGGDPVEEDMKEMEEEYTLGGDLASLDGYATGGLVEGMDVDGIIDRVKAAAAQDPSITNMLKAKGIFVQEPQPQGVQQQQAMSEGMTPTQAAPPVIQGQDTPTAFAEGGMVYGSGAYNPQQYASSFDPYAHTPGFSIESGVTGQAPGTDSVTPQCPTGYRWDATTQSCVPVSTSRLGEDGGGLGAPTQQRSDRSPAPVAGGNPNAWMEKYDYTSPENLFNQSMEKLGIRKEGAEEEEKSFLGSLGDAAKGLLGTSIAGGLVGKFMATTNAAQTAANARILRDMGRDDLADQLDAQNETYVKESGIGRVPEFMRDGDRLANSVRAVKGDQWSTDATQRAETSTSSSTGRSSTPAVRPQARPSAPSNSRDSRPNAASAHREANQVSTPTSASKAKAMTAARSAGVSAKTASKLSGSQMKAGSEVGSGSGGGTRVGPQNRGGFIQPRKEAKAKPVTKGKRGLAVKK